MNDPRHKLTAATQNLICGLIRAGAFPHVAALLEHGLNGPPPPPEAPAESHPAEVAATGTVLEPAEAGAPTVPEAP